MTNEQFIQGTPTSMELEAICRWLETCPSYSEVLASGLHHTVAFSVLYDQIGDETSGLGRDYP